MQSDQNCFCENVSISYHTYPCYPDKQDMMPLHSADLIFATDQNHHTLSEYAAAPMIQDYHSFRNHSHKLGHNEIFSKRRKRKKKTDKNTTRIFCNLCRLCKKEALYNLCIFSGGSFLRQGWMLCGM